MVAMFLAPHIVYMFAGGGSPTWLEFFVAIAFGVAAAFAMWLRGVHRQVWRHTSLRDVVRIFQGVALTHLMSLPILILAKTLHDFPICLDLPAIPDLAGAADGGAPVGARAGDGRPDRHLPPRAALCAARAGCGTCGPCRRGAAGSTQGAVGSADPRHRHRRDVGPALGPRHRGRPGDGRHRPAGDAVRPLHRALRRAAVDRDRDAAGRPAHDGSSAGCLIRAQGDAAAHRRQGDAGADPPGRPAGPARSAVSTWRRWPSWSLARACSSRAAAARSAASWRASARRWGRRS